MGGGDGRGWLCSRRARRDMELWPGPGVLAHKKGRGEGGLVAKAAPLLVGGAPEGWLFLQQKKQIAKNAGFCRRYRCAWQPSDSLGGYALVVARFLFERWVVVGKCERCLLYFVTMER